MSSILINLKSLFDLFLSRTCIDSVLGSAHVNVRSGDLVFMMWSGPVLTSVVCVLCCFTFYCCVIYQSGFLEINQMNAFIVTLMCILLEFTVTGHLNFIIMSNMVGLLDILYSRIYPSFSNRMN